MLEHWKNEWSERVRPLFQQTAEAMTFSTKRRVEFRDTDAAGIVHFSAFFPMMEAAEHEMLRSLG
ncbi:MAG: hypothetical protein MI861_25835, partial [Pirellulales bacterium]|nr:hypothetical protein [Pirellulales bacterium]